MTLDATFTREPGIVARRIAGETLLVPVTRRAREMALFTLNEVGTFVWERLDGGRPLAAIVPEIVDCFDVERERAAVDLREFVELLAQAGCAAEVRP